MAIAYQGQCPPGMRIKSTAVVGGVRMVTCEKTPTREAATATPALGDPVPSGNGGNGGGVVTVPCPGGGSYTAPSKRSGGLIGVVNRNRDFSPVAFITTQTMPTGYQGRVAPSEFGKLIPEGR